MDFHEFESFGSVIFFFVFVYREISDLRCSVALPGPHGLFERDNRTNTFSFGHDNVMYSWL